MRAMNDASLNNILSADLNYKVAMPANVLVIVESPLQQTHCDSRRWAQRKHQIV